MNWLRWLFPLLVFALAALVLLSGGCWVISEDEQSLTAGSVLHGQVLVLGGHLTVEPGARLDGNLLVVWGEVELLGEVTGAALALPGGRLRDQRSCQATCSCPTQCSTDSAVIPPRP